MYALWCFPNKLCVARIGQLLRPPREFLVFSLEPPRDTGPNQNQIQDIMDPDLSALK